MSGEPKNSAAVFALEPEWADLILSGTKMIEIRRSRMSRMIGRMLIYRTGTGLIIGEVRVKGMYAAPAGYHLARIRGGAPHPGTRVRRIRGRRGPLRRMWGGKEFTPRELRKAGSII